MGDICTEDDDDTREAEVDSGRKESWCDCEAANLNP